MTLNSLPVPNPAINVQLVMDEGQIPNSMYNTGQPANMENQFSHDNVHNNVEPNIPLLPPASFIPEPHSSEQNRYPIYPMQPKQMQQHSINTNHAKTSKNDLILRFLVNSFRFCLFFHLDFIIF